MRALQLALLCASTAFALGTGKPSQVTVHHAAKSGEFTAKPGINKHGAAWAQYADEVAATGWGRLTVESNGELPDEVQAYAAGFAEGVLTHKRIRQFARNTEQLRDAELLPRTRRFLALHDAHVRRVAESRRGEQGGSGGGLPGTIAPLDATAMGGPDDRGYWHHVHLVLRQLDGLRDGCNHASSDEPALTAVDLWMVNMDAELVEIEQGLAAGKITLPEEGDAAATTSVQESHAAAADQFSTDSSGAEVYEPEGGPGDDMQFRTVHGAAQTAQATTQEGAQEGTQVDPAEEAEMWERSFARHSRSRAAFRAMRAQGAAGPLADLPRFRAMLDSAAAQRQRQQEQRRQQRQQAQQRRQSLVPEDPAEAELLWQRLMRHSRCTALVRLTPGDRELLLGHCSWEDYAEMLRMYKHYRLPFRHPSTRARAVAFSSYPGMVASSDDFYLTAARLAVTETTINLLDEELLTAIAPSKGVASFVRAMVACRTTDTAKAWVRTYTHQNSGYYNCQWMVLDYKLFTPGSPLPPGTFWVAESVPGFAHAEDQTQFLNARRYWPSANRPLFASVRERAGYGPTRLHNGVDMFSFWDSPRAHILAQQGEGITGEGAAARQGMQRAMRYNHWQDDPLTLRNPAYTVAARSDLVPGPAALPSGATDAKVVTAADVAAMRTHAVCGPTTEGGLPAFSWSQWERSHGEGVRHEGMPDTFDFEWQVMVADAL